MKNVGARPWTAALVVTAVTLASVAPAVADPVPARDCDRSIDVGPDATACLGFTNGSDTRPQVRALIAQGGWVGFGVAMPVEFSAFDLDVDPDDASKGQLTLLEDLNGPFVLALRGRNDWAGYYFAQGAQADSVLSFDLPGTGRGAAVSRVSMYLPGAVAASTLALEEDLAVPEPSTLAMLVPGLLAIGIGARRRRRRS